MAHRPTSQPAHLAPRAVGVDLGTTFSAIAYLSETGTPVTIPNVRGHEVTPSAVLINPDRSIIVGEEALAARKTHPDRVAVNFKRDMGDKFFHETIGGKQFSPEALSALVIKKLAQMAERELQAITGAVITVPAYFGDVKRKATQDAGRIAGLNVFDIINEPTAAALANAFRAYLAQGGDRTQLDIARISARAPSTTLVYDLGGGTFDVTVIRIDESEFEVVATGGEVRLGGVDFDRRLVDFFAEEFQRRYGVDPRDTPESEELVRIACEEAKIALSSDSQTIIDVSYLGRRLEMPLTRKRFEDLTGDLFMRTQISVETLLEDALMTWDWIDSILLVGGSSRMPRVADMLANISGKAPAMAIAPDQIVAHGAAIHAAILSLADNPLTRTMAGGRVLDGGVDESTTDTNAEQQRMRAIFAAPVVEAAGAVTLTDVNAHSLGVIVHSSHEQRTVNSIIIPRNTPLPTARVKVFGTEAEDQRAVRLRITEGETRDPRGCVQIGELMIKQLPKGLPKGAPVEVAFRFDGSGRIHVRAVELTSRISADAVIERASGFDAQDLDKLTDAVAELDVE